MSSLPDRLKQLIHEIHRRSLWQVLGIYVLGGWLVLQAVDTLAGALNLPDWAPPLAFFLLIVGLPIVLATAFVQEGIGTGAKVAVRGPAVDESSPASGAQTLFTWRNAVLGGTVAFALWGVVAVGWIISGRKLPALAIGDPEGVRSIAALPFEEIGGDGGQSSLADGVHDQILTKLTRIAGLRVTSRTSVMGYRGTEKDSRTIGDELGVLFILTGLVQRAGDRILISARLVDAESDAQLWAEAYDRELSIDNLFDIQSEIATGIVEATEATLTPDEARRISNRPTDDLKAYDYYLRGKDHRLRSTSEQDFRLSITFFESAISLDPEFAVAYAELSQSHARMWWFYYDRNEERLARAKEAMERASELAPDGADTYLASGFLHYWGSLDYESALSDFRRVQELAPSDASGVYGEAVVLRRQGHMEEALEQFLAAQRLDPRAAVRATAVAETAELLQDSETAERYYDLALALSPDSPRPYYQKAWQVAARLEGDTEEGREILAVAKRLGIEQQEIAYTWVLLDLLDRDPRTALARIDSIDFPAFRTQFDYVPKPQFHARAYAMLGDTARALAYYDSTRIILESHVVELPNDDLYRASLGVVYAELGRSEDAVREGEMAVQLLPIEREAWRGSKRLLSLARVYAAVGRYDEAVDILDGLLSIPTGTTVPMLRLEAAWDPLRDHPRFQALLEEYEGS